MEKTRLSKRLKQLRCAYSYTQDYVASFLGVIRQTYSHYETGRCVPPTQTLYKLAGLYKISVEDLLHLSVEIDRDEYYDAPSPSTSSEDLSEYLDYYNDSFNRKKYRFFSNDEKELLFLFSMLDEEDKREIIEFTRIKAKKYKKTP
ncbi:MAG: helix-turn-helix domain-containing protein [Lachnospiraceae bacterium]|nr:helix-turn-helix domain-containing protein [Lachnospiraceae bacterium]